jgi:hypothetical protein
MRQPIGDGLEKETFVRRSGIGSEEQPSRMDKFRSAKFSHMHAEICLFYSLLEKYYSVLHFGRKRSLILSATAAAGA